MSPVSIPYGPEALSRRSGLAAVAVLFFPVMAAPAHPAELHVRSETEWAEALEECSRNTQADVIHMTSPRTPSLTCPFPEEDHSLTIEGHGHNLNGTGRARRLDIKNMKRPLTGAHVAIRNVRFVHGAAAAEDGLMVNFRTPENLSNVEAHSCIFEESRAVLREHGWGWGPV